MQILERKVAVDTDYEVSSVWAVPDDHTDNSRALVLAHGAGNDMRNAFLSHIHEALAEEGTMTVKFNFRYKEHGRKAPDRPPVLEATWRAIIDAVRNDPEYGSARLFIGGKSMGGRIASQLVAKGEPCDGLVLLGYPLHPPNKRDELRADHLSLLTCPMLFIQGTRDALCDLGLLRMALKSVGAPVTLHMIEGGDHSFKVLKSLGRREIDVWQEIVGVVAGWLSCTS